MADRVTWGATIEGFQRLTRVVLAAPVPAIAAIDGVCVGGALEFAAGCDLRLCTDRVRLLTPEVRIGLVASNAGPGLNVAIKLPLGSLTFSPREKVAGTAR